MLLSLALLSLIVLPVVGQLFAVPWFLFRRVIRGPCSKQPRDCCKKHIAVVGEPKAFRDKAQVAQVCLPLRYGDLKGSHVELRSR